MTTEQTGPPSQHPSMQWSEQPKLNLMDMPAAGRRRDGWDEIHTSRGHRIGAWIAAAATLGYLLPWALGVQRNLPRHRSLFWLNLLLGWTGIGWILAMIEVLLWRPSSYWQQVRRDLNR